MFRGTVVTILLTLFVVTAYGAQKELNFSDYLNIVRKNSLSIRIGENDAEKKYWEKLDSYGSFLPTAGLSVTWWHNSYEEALQPAGATEPTWEAKKSSAWNRSFKAKLPVLVGGSRFFGARMAQKNEELAKLELVYRKQKSEADAVVAFFSAYLTQKTLEVARSGLALADENYKNAEILKNSGRSTELDFLNFKLSLESRREEVSRYEMDFLNNISEMEKLAVTGFDTPILRIDNDMDGIISLFSERELNENFDRYRPVLMESSPLIAKARIALKISSDAWRTTIGKFFPTVALEYTHDFGTSENLFREQDKLESDLFAVNFGLNLFNGFSDSIDYKKKKLDRLKSRLLLSDIENSQLHSLRIVLTSIHSSIRRYDIAKLSLEISEKTREKTKLEYDRGRAAYLDLLSAENNYINAKKNLVTIESSILNGYFQLKLLLGREEL